MVNADVVFISFLFEFSCGVFLSIITALTFKRFFERRRNATLYLSCAILFLGVGLLIAGISHLIALILTFNPLFFDGNLYTPFSWVALALITNVIGDLLLLLFINEVFYNSSKKLGLITVLFGCIIAGLLLIIVPKPLLDPITSLPGAAYTDLFQILWLLLAVYTFFTGTLIVYSSLNAAREDRPLVERRGLQLISGIGIGLPVTIIFMLIDEIVMGGQFSIFYFLSLIVVVISVIFVYLGFILPNWLRKRWE